MKSHELGNHIYLLNHRDIIESLVIIYWLYHLTSWNHLLALVI